MTLRVFQTNYSETEGGEDSPAVWDWPTLLDKRYDDVELLGCKPDEDQDHHITDWADDAHMTTGAGNRSTVTAIEAGRAPVNDSPPELNRSIPIDPDRGDELGERVLIDEPRRDEPVVFVDGKPDMDATYEERARRGRVSSDPDQPIH